MPEKATSRVLIVGGCGFVGKSLAKALRISYRVFLMDIDDAIRNHDLDSIEGTDISKGLFFISGDMTKRADVEYAVSLAKPDLVVCLAGYGMSGSAMLDFKKCYDINYHGILNLIEVCKDFNICRLIYTSTYNVIYGGQRIDHGDESMDYYPIHKHTDGYSASKAEADRAVLKANNTLTANGSCFITSVIRPAAIYGEEEQRHFPRIVRIMDLGLFLFRIGQPLVDWVHVDNLVSQPRNRLA
jgi:nucleoside-diphosphate-sugar epimerase